MVTYRLKRLFLFIISLSSAFAEDGAVADMIRAEMLYNNHCIQCHTQQIHWRDNKLVSDWPDLVAQVDRWQRAAGLNWSSTDIKWVSRYLNGKYYHYP